MNTSNLKEQQHLLKELLTKSLDASYESYKGWYNLGKGDNKKLNEAIILTYLQDAHTYMTTAYLIYNAYEEFKEDARLTDIFGSFEMYHMVYKKDLSKGWSLLETSNNFYVFKDSLKEIGVTRDYIDKDLANL